MAKLPPEYAPGLFDPGTVIFRTARAAHVCRGDGAGGDYRQHAPECRQRIEAGEHYVEYVGEVPAYQSGTAHSIPCALAFGYITRASAHS